MFQCCKYLCVLSLFGHAQLFVTLWTVACQAPPSMGFSRQEYWSRLPCLPPGDLPNPGIKPMSLTSPALAGGLASQALRLSQLLKAASQGLLGWEILPAHSPGRQLITERSECLHFPLPPPESKGVRINLLYGSRSNL